MSDILPAIFFGHGNPMNALQTNLYTDAWRRMGTCMPKPRAILAISAHWSVPMTAVTVSTAGTQILTGRVDSTLDDGTTPSVHLTGAWVCDRIKAPG